MIIVCPCSCAVPPSLAPSPSPPTTHHPRRIEPTPPHEHSRRSPCCSHCSTRLLRFPSCSCCTHMYTPRTLILLSRWASRRQR